MTEDAATYGDEPPTPRPSHIQWRKARDGFRWRLLAANGLIIAESGEAYSRKANVLRAIDRFIELMAGEVVVSRGGE